MSEKGYVTATSVVLSLAIFVLTTILISPLYTSRTIISGHLDKVREYHYQKATLERIVAEYKNNISYLISPTEYADLGKEVNIVELEKETETFNETGEIIDFSIYSAATVEITAVEVEEEEDVVVTLYCPNDTVVFSEIGTDWIFDDIYCPDTDTWGYGYGMYTVEASHPVSVSFNWVSSRELDIETDFFQENLNVQNDNTGKNSLTWRKED